MSDNLHVVQKIAIHLLKPHPKQAELFTPISDEALCAFAADMADRGLQHPVEVLPDFTIIAGHERVRGALLLGWTEIDVKIRHDLAAQGSVAVEQHLICDNYQRKQLSPLSRARCAAYLKDLIRGRRQSDLQGDEFWAAGLSLSDEVGRMLGICRREADRVLLVLKAPRAIQEAFDRGELTLGEAGKAASINEELQAVVVAKIEGGMSAKDAMRPYMGMPRFMLASANKSYTSLLKKLESAIVELKDKIDDIVLDAPKMHSRIATIQAARELLQRLEGREHEVEELSQVILDRKYRRADGKQEGEADAVGATPGGAATDDGAGAPPDADASARAKRTKGRRT